MSKNPKIFPEKDYKEIIGSIGRFQYYLYEKDKTLPGNLFQQMMHLQDYQCVIAGTGDMLNECVIKAANIPENIIIPKNEQIVVIRLLRYDGNHDEPHFNADDQLIFPTQKGAILRIARNDAPDHFVKVCQEAGILTVADAYKLPTEKSGPVESYSAKGAKLHVNLKPVIY